MAREKLHGRNCTTGVRPLSTPLQVVALAPALALALSILACPSRAVDLNGDPAKGGEAAARLCVSCHAANPSAGRPPSLAQIANTPHYSIEKLRRIIAVPPHRAMLSPLLNQDEINDIAAYIRSLRKPAQ